MANKLELTWVGKENEIKVEPRLLIERPELSNMGKVHEFSEENSSRQRTTNMLIHGDNLLALKALEADFAGTVKCIYIARRATRGARLSIMTTTLSTASGFL